MQDGTLGLMALGVALALQVTYYPSGQLARKLGISSRTLGKITGNLFVEGCEGRVDLGLCVKNGAKGLTVPDYVTSLPEGSGWAYSDALGQVLALYKVTSYPLAILGLYITAHVCWAICAHVWHAPLAAFPEKAMCCVPILACFAR